MKRPIQTTRLLDRLAKILRSRKFFVAILALYLFQALFFSFAINTGDIYKGQYGVAPDEARHFGNVMYFAKQPILNGPFVSSMKDSDLVLGTVTTFPSNTFYYLMAIPVKVAAHLDFSQSQIYLMLRLIIVVCGALGLIIFRRLTLEVMNSKLIANVSVLALVSTGMYVWESAAISYDIPSLALMFLLMLYLTRIVRTGRFIPNALYVVAIFLSVGLIKYTYIPFAALFIAITVFMYIRSHGLKVSDDDHGWLHERANKLRLVAIAIVIFIASIVFIATIGRNLLQYHAVNPDCMRSVEVCNNFEIYWRNHKQAALYHDMVASGQIQPYRYTLFGHVGTWLDTYFISTYTYRGHVKEIKPMTYLMTLTLVAFICVLTYMLALLKDRISLRMRPDAMLLAIVALLYVLVVYAFNVKTLYDFGTSYAYQGRYTLFTLAILYAFLILLMVRFVDYYTSHYQSPRFDVRLALLGIVICAIVIFNPMVSLFMHVNSPTWFTDVARHVIPERLQH